MEYPHIPQHFSKEALFEHFNLTQDERYNLPHWRKGQNILGFAVLLKTFSFLGFPPRRKDDVPASVVSWISHQLDVDPQDKERYGWIKANPGKTGIKTLLREIRRIQFVNGFEIQAYVHLADIPDDVLKLLRERAAPEDAYQMKRHRPEYVMR